MPRRKRKQMDDDWEDYQHPVDPCDRGQVPVTEQINGNERDRNLSPVTLEVAKVSLSDFFIKEKVNAFIHAYEPCHEGDDGYEQMDDARLREVFKAYVCGLGDPLNLYIEDLKLANFRMEISMATGEPSLFVRRKQ